MHLQLIHDIACLEVFFLIISFLAVHVLDVIILSPCKYHLVNTIIT